MTLRELSQDYANSIAQSDERKTYCKEDFLAGATTTIMIVEDLIHQLREEGKDLWAASYVLEKFEELKGESK